MSQKTQGIGPSALRLWSCEPLPLTVSSLGFGHSGTRLPGLQELLAHSPSRLFVTLQEAWQLLGQSWGLQTELYEAGHSRMNSGACVHQAFHCFLTGCCRQHPPPLPCACGNRGLRRQGIYSSSCLFKRHLLSTRRTQGPSKC